MRHLKKKKFGKGKDHRRKLLKSLASSVILYEKIQTSISNARAVKAYTEKLITRSKNNTLHNRRLLLARLSLMATKKALEVLGPKYKDRKGGYLRTVKLVGSNTGNSKVLVELID